MSALQLSPTYQRNGTVYVRCSRCRTEHQHFTDDGLPNPTLAQLRLGSDVLGLVCQGCELAIRRHVASVWSDCEGLPFVDGMGAIVNTRCRVCGTPYGLCAIDRHTQQSDGLQVSFRCCEQCNHGGAP